MEKVIAVDTNVLVRFLIRDPDGFDLSKNALAREALVLGTVWLENEWVLRSVYRMPAIVIAEAFEGLLGFPNLVVPERAALVLACGLAREGMDFADSFHLAQARRASNFVTFDRELLKRGSRAGLEVALTHPSEIGAIDP